MGAALLCKAKQEERTDWFKWVGAEERQGGWELARPAVSR